MKKLLLLLVLSFSTLSVFAQEVPNYSAVSLAAKEDYAKAEGTVLKAADYLISTPFDKKNPDRLRAMQFILKWMEGTPDFTFQIDETPVKISDGNSDLLGLYLACATKYCIENRSMAKDAKAVKLNTLKTLVTYSTNPTYKVKQTGELKKVIKASEKGELEQYVG
ncbi:hypothetical protein [Rufibacter hautae]|uniref:Uncharacterized protein n=1 Tax=Rufibacter hautae TaxID=2595005 RepID=A0A5B6TFX7_9BACT|nr:hypothetical protein [Rufibacter hautae]KAA3439554.1 hypothetical protein FOA19_02385 [Rufibacter hautae]